MNQNRSFKKNNLNHFQDQQALFIQGKQELKLIVKQNNQNFNCSSLINSNYQNSLKTQNKKSFKTLNNIQVKQISDFPKSLKQKLLKQSNNKYQLVQSQRVVQKQIQNQFGQQDIQKNQDNQQNNAQQQIQKKVHTVELLKLPSVNNCHGKLQSQNNTNLFDQKIAKKDEKAQLKENQNDDKIFQCEITSNKNELNKIDYNKDGQNLTYQSSKLIQNQRIKFKTLKFIINFKQIK
ncbi:tetratricopeptide repeat protein (macronuclear) [Tetrahymena thermophila SB210]|uniref:Tetratricopeptide repeat protein n=1 Tax=Tetrahymena thermophila (strain SB210) TaxID=312017 RepID=W7X4U7_TETTS|nr:tetratricopeptide repeat protein [Tetrahymena thermophila SB210]EWS71398.1 tetratricopeptide repeat protein [Tetrahymena thermophila SB210]|eukprot:XP_012656070.1 tetratricopeptide repeat protein [Tetrahymena thermophila SB210]